MSSNKFLFSLLFFFAGISAFSDEEPIICGTENSVSVAQPRSRVAADTVGGNINVLMLRIGFSDVPYAVATEAQISAVNAKITEFMRANSENRLNMTFTIHPEIWTYPFAQADVAFKDLQKWITATVKEKGLIRGTDWDRYIVNFPKVSDASWSGLSTMTGGGSNFTNNRYSEGLAAHELGHSLGLSHATSLEAVDQIFGTFDPDSEDVERIEYGDTFDVMGGGGYTGHFNTKYKQQLGWLNPVTEIKNVTSSGTYRIYAHDLPARSHDVLALQIPAGDPNYSYWVEYRTALSSRKNNRKGVTIRMVGYWKSSSGKPTTTSTLLDLSPGSLKSSDFGDAALEPGKVFEDHFKAFTMTVTGQNENVWDENGWIEVNVQLANSPLVKSEKIAVPNLSSPWEGYTVRDLRNKVWEKESRLPIGLYVQVPHDHNLKNRLYYQK